MALYRYGRSEYKKQQKRLFIAIAGSIGLLVLIFVLGLPILVNFSLLVDKLHGKTPSAKQKSVIIPPVLDPLPTATNSAALTITGVGTPDMMLELYENNEKIKSVNIPGDGKFSVSLLGKPGDNSFFAKHLNDQNEESEPSNVITTKIIRDQPKLDITSPEDNASFSFENNTATIEGKTDPGNSVTINGRIIIVQNDGTFKSTLQLNEGDNTIVIEAKDIAGNTTKAERNVTYQR